MHPRRWFDSSQPQTLQIAVILQYLNSVIAVVMVVFGAYPLWFLLLVAEGIAAYGIANELKWGYWTGVVASGLYLGLSLLAFFLGQGVGLLSLLISAALFALLVHPLSRGYERVWFH
ncbi:MAG: hypothetical protein ACYCTL_09445 [Acidimicrobiales bacterium]